MKNLSLVLSVAGFLSCSQEKGYRFSEVATGSVENFAPEFKEYCNLDLSAHFELNAVQCSFYGDYRNALDQASKNQAAIHPNQASASGRSASTDRAEAVTMLKAILNPPDANDEAKASAQKILDLVSHPPVDVLLADAQALPAVNFIAEQAKGFHFTLINEAHYSSQHRAFTRELLKPLWDQGYRYLALEALEYSDTNLGERGYPLMNTGYYIKDSNFGNLVREALLLGYTLVTYETQNSRRGGTLRDRDQAQNIYDQTLARDRTGKVLIHAGYSHISETGGATYEPMGYQLKNLAGEDILTVDQVTMVGLNSPAKHHSYYKEAIKRPELAKGALVFVDCNGEPLIDPVNSYGIDVQVYHPITRFEKGRPHWLKKDGVRQIPLVKQLLEYEGFLIQATPLGEDENAVPVDQFVISEEKHLFLKPGNYLLRVISCEGGLVATSVLEVV